MLWFASCRRFFSFASVSVSETQSAFAGKVSDSDEIMNKHKYLASFIYTLLLFWPGCQGGASRSKFYWELRSD